MFNFIFTVQDEWGPRQSEALENLRERLEAWVPSRDAGLGPTPTGGSTLPSHSLLPSLFSKVLEPWSLQGVLQIPALMDMSPAWLTLLQWPLPLALTQFCPFHSVPHQDSLQQDIYQEDPIIPALDSVGNENPSPETTLESN